MASAANRYDFLPAGRGAGRLDGRLVGFTAAAGEVNYAQGRRDAAEQFVCEGSAGCRRQKRAADIPGIGTLLQLRDQQRVPMSEIECRAVAGGIEVGTAIRIMK